MSTTYPISFIYLFCLFLCLMEILLQYSSSSVLFDILLCPLYLGAEEPGTGLDHKTGKRLTVLFFCDDAGLFLCVGIPDGHRRSCWLGG